MIDPGVFLRIQRLYNRISDQLQPSDILSALTEELGEFSRAWRVERNALLCHNKTVDESSRVEIVDLMLICVEAYLAVGGTYPELHTIVERKLAKWENLWKETLERQENNVQ